MIAQGTTRRGTRCSTGKAFLRPARLRKNLHVAMDSHVTRVLIDHVTKRAFGVEFSREGKLHVIRARKEIIISGGSVNSPQLLMLSGIGPREHLQVRSVDYIRSVEIILSLNGP
jgi:glucose dehydrogenase (acceptor)